MSWIRRRVPFACAFLIASGPLFSDSLPAVRLGPAAAPFAAAGPAGDAELMTLGGELVPRLLALRAGGALLVEGWPTAPGERGTVELARFDVYAPGARIVRVEGERMVDVPRSRLAFFRGAVAEEPAARVLAVVDPDLRTLTGTTSRPEGAHELRPAGRRGGETLYRLAPRERSVPEAGGEPSWSCGQQASPLDALRAPSSLPRPFAAAAISSLHTAVIAVDTDNELLQLKFGNNTTAATNYIASLIARMSVMYERDLLVRLVQGLTILRPSTTPDPYAQSGTGSADFAKLNEFSNYWAAGCGGACAGVSRALAMMLSGKQGSAYSASGIAWVDSLCSTATGYSFSQVFKFAQDTSAWDARMVGHEVGHNFGSLHTHCYLPPADTCFNGEPGCFAGVPSCPAPATYNGVANVTGTVMSYCHNLSGCTSAEVFHPASVAVLAPEIESRVGQCIFPLLPPLLSDGFESGVLPGAWSYKVP